MNIRKLGTCEEPPMELLLSADPSLRSVGEYLQRGNCFIAEENGQIIGVYVLLLTRPETVELVNLAVTEARQGTGVGKKLLQHAIQTAKAMGSKTIEAGTGNSSIGQLAFYQKSGFRITGVDIDFFVRRYPEEIFENGIRCRDMIRMSLEL